MEIIRKIYFYIKVYAEREPWNFFKIIFIFVRQIMRIPIVNVVVHKLNYISCILVEYYRYKVDILLVNTNVLTINKTLTYIFKTI